jgi:prephenate dehydrogenase
MCGKERNGFGVATADLYHNQTFILCPTERTTRQVRTTAETIIDHIGARLLLLPPDVHDEWAALVSHLPYVAAAALVGATRAVRDDRLWQVSASGFRDASRLAGSAPGMMLDILLTNKTAVLQQLTQFGAGITAVVELLQRGNEEELRQWLEAAQAQYRNYKENYE